MRPIGMGTKKTTKTNGGGMRQMQIRMDDELKKRVRNYQVKLKKETGLDVSFSSAIRSLIEKALGAQ